MNKRQRKKAARRRGILATGSYTVKRLTEAIRWRATGAGGAQP